MYTCVVWKLCLTLQSERNRLLGQVKTRDEIKKINEHGTLTTAKVQLEEELGKLNTNLAGWERKYNDLAAKKLNFSELSVYGTWFHYSWRRVSLNRRKYVTVLVLTILLSSSLMSLKINGLSFLWEELAINQSTGARKNNCRGMWIRTVAPGIVN